MSLKRRNPLRVLHRRHGSDQVFSQCSLRRAHALLPADNFHPVREELLRSLRKRNVRAKLCMNVAFDLPHQCVNHHLLDQETVCPLPFIVMEGTGERLHCLSEVYHGYLRGRVVTKSLYRLLRTFLHSRVFDMCVPCRDRGDSDQCHGPSAKEYLNLRPCAPDPRLRKRRGDPLHLAQPRNFRIMKSFHGKQTVLDFVRICNENI